MASLSSVVRVDPERCVNCHACIAVCPVKFCNDGSGDFIAVNDDLCIGCGSCLQACTHGARVGVDDADQFFADVGTQPFVALAAPAVASSFPDQYLRLNGWLASLGVQAFFDVSFGAELTVKSYLSHIQSHAPQMVIAQPCPAIVTYVEIYRPELVRHLAPKDSPMAHTIRLVREHYRTYARHRIVVLSPCYAKRREFDELGLGTSVLNVTYQSLADRIRRDGVDLNQFPEVAFTSPAAERAVLFSTPGGLLRTVEREFPEAVLSARKIEGPRTIYPYLDQLGASLAKGTQPLLVDCLNCEHGCNGGPGTLGHGKSLDEVEFPVEQRSRAARKSWPSTKKLSSVIDRYWSASLYDRTYADLTHHDQIRIPGHQALKVVYARMKKFNDEDIYNCNTCGYGSCEKMAVAIFNGLNRPENCHHYNLELVRVEVEKSKAEEEKLVRIAQENARVTQAIESIVERVSESNRLLLDKTQQLTEITEAERQRFHDILDKLEEISVSLRSLDGVVKTIIDISRKSHILAINASIESSRAGRSGQAFGVVADEVKRMAVQTQDEAKKIRPFAEKLQAMMELFSQRIGQSFEGFNTQAALIQEVTQVASQLKTIAQELETKAQQLHQGPEL